MANKYLNLTGLGTLVDQIKGKFALQSSLNDLKGNIESLSKALVFKGVATSADDLNIPSAKVGDVYIASPKSGTFSVGGQYVESGDMIIAQTVISTPTRSVTWAVVQANINGAVTATADITAEHVVVGSGRKTVKDLTPSAGYLYWNGTKHVYQTPSAYSLPLAASGVRGGIQIGYTDSSSNRKYGLKLENEKAYVNVPWKDVVISSQYMNATSADSGNTRTITIGKPTEAEYAHSYKTSTDASAESMPFTTKFDNIDGSIADIENRLDTVEGQLRTLPSFEAITETEITNLFK